MELATIAVAVGSAARPHGRFSSPCAVSISWNNPSLSSTSRSLSTSSASRRRRLPAASAAVELREAASGGGDSVRVTETLQPGSSVKFSVEVPTSIIQECYQSTLQEYAKRFKVPGFRPGKTIPENLLINYVGPQHVQDATIEAILKHTLPQALSSVEERALEDSVRILTQFDDMRSSFSLDDVFRYDVAVDVVPEVRWLSEDKYKNLKVVVEIDEAVDAEKAAEKELQRRHKALGLLRIVADRGLQGLLDRASITDHRTDETPMELNVHLSASDGESLDDPTRYRHIIDFGVSVFIPTPFLTDSTGAISIARDLVKHELTKHMGVDAYYTRKDIAPSCRLTSELFLLTVEFTLIGDLVVLDISAESINSDGSKGEKISSAESTGFHLDTEENNNLVPGFLGSLIGIRPGETRSFPIQFPESFGQESLRGVCAQFTVVCKELFYRELPEMDDSLAGKLLPGCTTIDEVQQRILDRCKEVEKTAIEQATDNAILDQLGKLVEVDVPRALFQEQGQQLYGAKLLQLQAERKLDKDQLASLSSQRSVQAYLEDEKENITRIIKQMLAVSDIFKSENLQYSTEQLIKEVENSVAEFKQYNQDYDENNIKQQVQDVLEAAKVLEWLKENCTIEYVRR
ncbi:hypothetical protein U9M48_028736 [Paspalum notatum var. saurae]|uniref:peptidylprolyl isomerase n=1 Tax=Paspalum notatum var. saurae TaxID=547442 RepID=A0AAQ3TXV8_PASNO